jgi:hypothetical protein
MDRTIAAIALVMAALVVAACDVGSGSSAESDGGEGAGFPVLEPAILADLVGPWRREPVGLLEVTARRIGEACSATWAVRPACPYN